MNFKQAVLAQIPAALEAGVINERDARRLRFALAFPRIAARLEKASEELLISEKMVPAATIGFDWNAFGKFVKEVLIPLLLELLKVSI